MVLEMETRREFIIDSVVVAVVQMSQISEPLLTQGPSASTINQQAREQQAQEDKNQ